MTWEELFTRAANAPINVDISDQCDEFCDGFLSGQVSILEEIQAGRLELPEDRP